MKAGKLKVGVRMIGGKRWMGGVSYVELIIKAINAVDEHRRPSMFLVVADSNLPDYYLHANFVHFFDGVIYVGNQYDQAAAAIGNDFKQFTTYDELSDYIDFYFPVLMDVLPHRCAASWIPDFQYRYLPELTSAEERMRLDVKYQNIADQAKLIVFSSHDAEKDFTRFYPNSKAIRKILNFHVNPDPAWYKQDPKILQTKFRLPDKFVLCCNQFWAHKNYELLFQSIAKLKREGYAIPLVCTGATEDFRVRSYFDQLQELIKELEITEQVYILGIVEREEQIQLIRRSAVVVQPSLFEGWSTIVEECRVLGKTLVLSDLNVNKEQNPNYAYFFNRSSVEDLAQTLLNAFLGTTPGPDMRREEEAREQAKDLIRRFANTFLDIVETGVQIFN